MEVTFKHSLPGVYTQVSMHILYSQSISFQKVSHAVLYTYKGVEVHYPGAIATFQQILKVTVQKKIIAYALIYAHNNRLGLRACRYTSYVYAL